MTKNILKSISEIHSDSNLTLEEKHLLTILIKYHNSNYGYAFPTYEILCHECSTKRRAKISKIIKGLVAKNYVEVKKVSGNKSIYYIKKHLYFVEETTTKKDVESVEDNLTKEDISVEVKDISMDVENDGKQHSNNSKIAKHFEKDKKFKLSKFYCMAFSLIDEIVLEMALKSKCKTAKLLLIRCINLTKQIGLEVSKELFNKVINKFDEYKEEWNRTPENSVKYVEYIDLKI